MDILSSDFLMTLFSAALHSYKHDSLLHPFPIEFINNANEKDFDALKIEVNEIPEFALIDWKDTASISHKAIKLLKWILKPRRFTLTLSPAQKFMDIVQLGGETVIAAGTKPDYVFEVLYNSQEEEKFTNIRGNRDILYAYHGSRTENFYSILHNGLQGHLNKTSLFGEGIYLSSDLRICQTYSPAGPGWEKSLFGNALSCIAVCEVIDHPDVKCSVKRSVQAFKSDSTIASQQSESQFRNRYLLSTSANQSDTSTSAEKETCQKHEIKTEVTSKNRAFIPGSEGGKIPDKYYVVRNNDLVRVKYLLVHAPNAQKSLISQLLAGKKVDKGPRRQGFLRAAINRYKFFFVMLLYVFVIFFISVWNSKAFSSWWRRFINNGEKDSMLL